MINLGFKIILKNQELNNNNEILDWKEGASESVILAIVSFFTFGIFVILSDFERLLFNPTTIIYIIILLFGTVSNIDALQDIKITKKSFIKGIALGFVCLIILAVVGIIFNLIPGFTLLEVPPLNVDIKLLEQLSYQLSFVAFSEELVFRNTLPRVFSEILKGVTKNKFIILAISFEISALLFGFVHFIAYGFNLLQIFIAFIAGNILGIFRIFGNLFTSTFAHLMYNISSIGIFSLSPQLSMMTSSLFLFLL